VIMVQGGIKLKLSKICTGIFLVIILSCIVFPIESRNEVGCQIIDMKSQYSNADVEQLSDVPYVWQEINGFCLWSAMTMAIQYAGVDIDLHDLFAVSGIGFSAFYARSGSGLSFTPGVFFHQIDMGDSTSKLLGLNITYYFDISTQVGSNALYALHQRGIEPRIFFGEEAAWGLMKIIIDAGYPLVISVDPYHLPPEDYDILRDQGITYERNGVGHTILVVGYNDTAEVAYIMDPGVGSFGDNYGFPQDGRWSYNVSYRQLSLAWEPLCYTAISIMPGDGTPADFGSRLGEFVCDRLLGNRTSYFQGYENFYFYSVGANAFRGLSLDMTKEGLKLFLEEFQAKEQILRLLGNHIEAGMTLQYLSYRTALKSLPNLLPDIDLVEFLEAGRLALPHLEALSDNSTLISLNGASRDSLLFTTFNGIADSYEANLNIDETLDEYSDEIEVIAGHLLAIADSWKSAGESLSTAIGHTQQSLLGQITIIAAGVSVIIVVSVIVVRKIKM
jgi:hypothetical protein